MEQIDKSQMAKFRQEIMRVARLLADKGLADNPKDAFATMVFGISALVSHGMSRDEIIEMATVMIDELIQEQGRISNSRNN